MKKLPTVILERKVHKKQTCILIKFEYNAALIALTRTLDNAFWSATLKSWNVKDTDKNLALINKPFIDKAVINLAQLAQILNTTRNFNATYGLDTYNCTDFALDLGNLAGLGLPEANGTWTGGGGSNLNTQEAKGFDTLRVYLRECETYDMELKNVADQQISFDLDDGVTVNYKKFETVVAKIK